MSPYVIDTAYVEDYSLDDARLYFHIKINTIDRY